LIWKAPIINDYKLTFCCNNLMMALSQLQKRLFASSITQRKVAPSAWFYLANYNIDAAKVQATGPRGHLTKEDLLLFIAKNNL